MASPPNVREGSLDAPIRHPLDWRSPSFHDEGALLDELARVFDHCHGCRRCVSLCNAFPTLFDLVDASATLEMDGVARTDYWQVVDHCYLCDLCYQTKCPYIPPHEWNIDFPHLMLRAKAVKFRKGEVGAAEKILSSTDTVGRLAGIPVVVNAVNAANQWKPWRRLLSAALDVDANARVPKYHSDTLRKRHKAKVAAATEASASSNSEPTEPTEPTERTERTDERTSGKVAIFATCFGNYNEPDLGEDLIAVLAHNGIEIELVGEEQCCGMPKLELGDLEAVARAKRANLPALATMVERGFDILAPVPSCVLMFRQELPLMFAADAQVRAVADAIFDPFEYLMRRHREGKLDTDFAKPLGKVAYHVACHQRVQKIGAQTKQCLQLVPGTEVIAIERCSGHDGTYGVKRKSHRFARKIARPVVNKVKQAAPDHYGSDCPMAGRFIEHGLDDGSRAEHPISLLRAAYGI
ncbi:MAG: heterodisulfide reductase-related iron-sulfur binding cluster [bacterium]